MSGMQKSLWMKKMINQIEGLAHKYMTWLASQAYSDTFIPDLNAQGFQYWTPLKEDRVLAVTRASNEQNLTIVPVEDSPYSCGMFLQQYLVPNTPVNKNFATAFTVKISMKFTYEDTTPFIIIGFADKPTMTGVTPDRQYLPSVMTGIVYTDDITFETATVPANTVLTSKGNWSISDQIMHTWTIQTELLWDPGNQVTWARHIITAAQSSQQTQITDWYTNAALDAYWDGIYPFVMYVNCVDQIAMNLNALVVHHG